MDSIWSTAWTKDDMIVSGSVDETVKTWKFENNDLQLKHTIGGQMLGAISLKVNQSGDKAVVSSLDSHIRLLDLEEGKVVGAIDAGAGEAWHVALSPSGDFVATGSQHGYINIYEMKSALVNGTNGEATPPKQKLQTSTSTGTKASVTQGKFVMSLDYSPDGKYLASGGYDGRVHIFDLGTGTELATLGNQKKPIRSVKFSCDSKFLMVGCDDMNIFVYDTSNLSTNGKSDIGVIANLSSHVSWVLSVATNPTNANQFATGAGDRRVKIWDLGERKCIHTFENHSDQVWSVAYNSTGTRLLSGGDDALLQLYELS